MNRDYGVAILKGLARRSVPEEGERRAVSVIPVSPCTRLYSVEYKALENMRFERLC